jgi:hypothetical protein
VPQNIFKIYDGRTSFWQWDTKQKLIVLDEHITEVRFSNRNMEHSKRRPVYTDSNGVRICNVPDLLLQLPKNLIAYACIKNEDGTSSTVKAVKFAVNRQPIPSDYVCEQDAVIENILTRLELLEAMLKDVNAGTKQFIKFTNMVEAAQWAVESGEAGDIVVIKLDIGWVPHIVEDDKSMSPVCDCDGNDIVMNLDGDDANGYDKTETYQIWDGGSAAGI